MGDWGMPFENMYYFSPEELCNRPVMIRTSINMFGGSPRAGITYRENPFAGSVAECNWYQPTSNPPETTGLRLQCLYENFYPVPSQSLTLTLTPTPNQTPPDPRPKGAEGKDGKSTLELVAKVMEGSAPKAGVAVTFAVEVAANSGGHDHHDATRPKGKVTANSPVTDANGEIKVTFQASQVAGTHVVVAFCSSCTNTSVINNVDVKVPGLVPFLVLPFNAPQWNTTGVGGTVQHASNHFLTVAATYRMLEIASKYKQIWPTAPQLTLNDASLEWGGKFDIDGTWETNPRRHAEHRLGDNIDIRANTRPGAVPSDIREEVLRWFRKSSTKKDNISPDYVIESVNPLHEGIGEANEHFHLRLGN